MVSISSLLLNQTFYYWDLLETLDRVVVQPIFLIDYQALVPDFPPFDLDVFDDFQWKLCKILGFIVLTNLALIYVFWKVYGDRIVDKFMQPSSSSKLIEELKLSISELKLPKEHSPRI